MDVVSSTIFEHRHGKNHTNADTMSRLSAPSSILAVFQRLVADLSVIKAAQQADSTLSPVVTALAQGDPLPSGIAPGLKRTFLEESVLCRMFRSSSSSPGNLQVAIPDTLKSTVLQQLHNQSGHLGSRKTLQKIQERYYWPGYESDTKNKDVPSFLSKVHDSLHTVYDTVRNSIASAYQCNKERYDKERPFSPYSVGDLVWLHFSAVKPGRTKKFATQWKGLYTVIDRVAK